MHTLKKRSMKFFSNLFNFLKSKQFLINLGLLVMVYLIVIISSIYFLNSKTNHGQKVEVPNYIGKNIRQVAPLLETLDLSYEIVDSIYAPDKVEGTILYQDPLPTSESDVYVKEGRKIHFRVSKKTRLMEVPLMVDRSERYAVSVLKNMGLKAAVTYQPSLEANGAVLAQKFKNKDMILGDKVPVGSTIYLVVGQGYETSVVEVPNLECLTINQVKERLLNYSGLKVYENYVNCRTREDSLRSRVIFQNPAYNPGEMIPGNSGISITLDPNGCN